MDRAAFKDFVVCKALDVISGNCAYRKYLHQCCENGEEWALKVSANVASVSLVIKELHALVDRVRRLPNSRLGKVCGEIVSSMHSPVRVIPGWSTCGLVRMFLCEYNLMRNPLCLGIITDCQAQNCIDVSRATKQNQSIPVHSKFQYFVLMCFYCCRIEHVVRTYTKIWLEGQPTEADMNQLTARFQEQDELFAKMYDRFVEGHAHVKASLEAYLCDH
jgi:hypothetical protein